MILGSFLLFSACDKKTFFAAPNHVVDDFELHTEVDSMLWWDYNPSTSRRWSATQITLDGNTINVDSTNAISGDQCLRFFAQGTSGDLSKSSIFNNDLSLWEGETVLFSGWYYLVGTARHDNLFIWDLEESTPVGAGPGLRLMMGEDGAWMLERGKMGQSTIRQEDPVQVFPRDQWVEIRMEIYLSQKKDGYVRIWQDSTLIIDAVDIQTLPKDRLFHTQGTAARYTNIEIGLTANPYETDAVLYVDDIRLEIQQ
ncbi:MAG: heparin lyase I family protein [Bacteroidota bacterium]